MSSQGFKDRLARFISDSSPILKELVLTLFFSTTSFLAVYKIAKFLRERDMIQNQSLDYLDKKIAYILKKRGFTLDKYESIIARDASIEQLQENGFDNLGGMKQVKETIIQALVYPMKHPELFGNKNSLRQFPRGVLLYGPPGTGKTTLAKIVAQSCGCAFIHVRKELLGAKYFGESEKMVAAVFSLARKLSPVIIFIDEIESVFPNRAMEVNSHRVHQLQLSIMLENWDGFKAENKIMILGATNMVNHLDPAALRRFQYQFKVDLPSREERIEILKILLKNDDVSPDFDYEKIATLTDKFSGSALKDVLQESILLPIQYATKNDLEKIAPLTTKDVLQILNSRFKRS